MLRNHKYEKNKEYLRLDKLSSQLREEFRNPKLIPLTEKIQIGWDVSLELTSNISRKDEAPILNEVMTILRLNEPIYMKNVKWLKYIRRIGHSFTKYVDDATYYGLKHWFNYRKRITEKQYLALSPQVKKYFTKNLDNFLGRADYHAKKNPYKLSSFYFPDYYLKFKVKKSYATHQAIPNHRLESDAQNIGNFLHDQVHFYGSKNGFTRYWNSCKDIIMHRAKRRSWKAALSQMKNQDEETQDFIFSKTKAHRRFKI